MPVLAIVPLPAGTQARLNNPDDACHLYVVRKDCGYEFAVLGKGKMMNELILANNFERSDTQLSSQEQLPKNNNGVPIRMRSTHFLVFRTSSFFFY